MHQIWIKPNNRYDDPRQWIQKGYISFSYINAQHSYYWLEKETGLYHFVTKLHSGDYIYVFEVNKDSKKSLLKYKFEIASDYDFNYHGYKIKNTFECLDEINQFDGNKTNGRQKWSAHKNFNTNGKIIKKCINCNNWKLIKHFWTNKVVSNQELIDADTYIKKHIENEGKIITQTIASHNRSQTLRNKYLEKYGTECKLCHKVLLKANGNDCIIDVHHLHPISNGERETNIDTDLVGLCPNCHRFVHTIKDFENKSLDQIKQILNKINNKN